MLNRLRREFAGIGMRLEDATPEQREEAERLIAEQFVRTVGPKGFGVRGPLFVMEETIRRAREIEAGRAVHPKKNPN
jgi:hypothetical protein